MRAGDELELITASSVKGLSQLKKAGEQKQSNMESKAL